MSMLVQPEVSDRVRGSRYERGELGGQPGIEYSSRSPEDHGPETEHDTEAGAEQAQQCQKPLSSAPTSGPPSIHPSLPFPVPLANLKGQQDLLLLHLL